MPKTIVPHQNPDLDAIMSTWLLVRFDQPRYGDAKLVYIPGSTTYKDLPVDGNPDVVHVDVGFGRYDHHQKGRQDTCASELVYKSLVEEGLVKPSDEALKAMIEHARAIDLFLDYDWSEANETRFSFTLSEIIPALHRLQIHEDEVVVRMIMVQLDGVYQKMKDLYKAREEIKEGVEFQSVWGKGLMVESGADNVHKIAQRMGYEIVLVKNEKSQYIGIKTVPSVEKSLRPLYDKIHKLDGPPRLGEAGEGKWFYHNSGHMLLHGSSKGKKPEPSKLSIEEILELIKSITD